MRKIVLVPLVAAMVTVPSAAMATIGEPEPEAPSPTTSAPIGPVVPENPLLGPSETPTPSEKTADPYPSVDPYAPTRHEGSITVVVDEQLWHVDRPTRGAPKRQMWLRGLEPKANLCESEKEWNCQKFQVDFHPTNQNAFIFNIDPIWVTREDRIVRADILTDRIRITGTGDEESGITFDGKDEAHVQLSATARKALSAHQEIDNKILQEKVEHRNQVLTSGLILLVIILSFGTFIWWSSGGVDELMFNRANRRSRRESEKADRNKDAAEETPEEATEDKPSGIPEGAALEGDFRKPEQMPDEAADSGGDGE